MTVIHKHDSEEFHAHSEEEYASHAAMTDEIGDSDATAAYVGHTATGTEDTAAGEALRESQAQGYVGQDAADVAGGTEALREDMGARKDGPGAPDYPPGHPGDPTVPPSAGTTSHDGDGGTDAEAGTA